MIRLLFTSVKFATEAEKKAQEVDPALAAHLDSHVNRWRVQVRFDLPTETPEDLAFLTEFDGVLAGMLVGADKRRTKGVIRLREEIAAFFGASPATVALPAPEPEVIPEAPSPDQPEHGSEEETELERLQAEAAAIPEEVFEAEREIEARAAQGALETEKAVVEVETAQEPAQEPQEPTPAAPAIAPAPAPQPPPSVPLTEAQAVAKSEAQAKAHPPSDDPGPDTVVDVPKADRKAGSLLADLFKKLKDDDEG